MENKNEEQSESGLETRRAMLRKIGASLAAISVGALVSNEASGQKLNQIKNIRIAPDVKTVLPTETKELNVFVAIQKGRGASAIVVDSSDTETVRKLKTQLKVNPANAVVNGGIIQLDLGVAAEGRCSGNSVGAAVAFNPRGPIEMNVKPIVRQ
jgi:hypothetical protein